jgi:hypothetical protein
MVRARRGDYRRAAADAEEALRHGPESWRLHHNAARVLAQAAAAADASPQAGDPRLRELRGAYQDRAVACLRNALDLHPAREREAFWAEQVQRDPIFESLSRNPGFLRLAAQYSRPAARQ